MDVKLLTLIFKLKRLKKIYRERERYRRNCDSFHLIIYTQKIKLSTEKPLN